MLSELRFGRQVGRRGMGRRCIGLTGSAVAPRRVGDLGRAASVSQADIEALVSFLTWVRTLKICSLMVLTYGSTSLSSRGISATTDFNAATDQLKARAGRSQISSPKHEISLCSSSAAAIPAKRLSKIVLRVRDLGRLLRPAALRQVSQIDFPFLSFPSLQVTHQLTAMFFTSDIGSLSSLTTSSHRSFSVVSS